MIIIRWWCRLEFKPQDMWVGAYWHSHHVNDAHILDIWVCILPMLPIHIQINTIRVDECLS
jgi:hypothetical protein